MDQNESRRRSRSATPPRLKSRKDKGFRWKEKPKRNEGDDSGPRNSDEKRLERGYRHDRERPDGQKRVRDRDREPDQRSERSPQRDSDRKKRRRSHSPRSAEQPEPLDDDIAAKFGSSAKATAAPVTNPFTKTMSTQNPSPQPRSFKPPNPPIPTASSSSELMILVTVNDRLGSKTKIPCYASDPIKAFKMMVAAKIGRKPHEIMLKRQGERPMKDFLTLEDYGVSSGVQLDLELDTGD